MRKIECKRLNTLTFRKYGDYQSILHPEGEKIGDKPSEFFRDMAQIKLGNTNILSVSSLRIGMRPMIVDLLEYHNFCGEAIIPLDADIIVQLAPATSNGEIPYNKIEAFYVPKGTIVVLNPGVWHHSPFVCNNDEAHLLCMLPERTYENDAHVVQFPDSEKLEITSTII